jgi:hypothetical protein
MSDDNPSVEARGVEPSGAAAATRAKGTRSAPDKPLPPIPDHPPGMDEQQVAGWVAAHTPSDKAKDIVYANISAGADPAHPDVSARSSGRAAAPMLTANIAGGGRVASGASRAGATRFLHFSLPDGKGGPTLQRLIERLLASLWPAPSRPELSLAATKAWMEERGRRRLIEEGKPWGRDEAIALTREACGGSERRAGKLYSKLPKDLRVGRGKPFAIFNVRF